MTRRGIASRRVARRRRDARVRGAQHADSRVPGVNQSSSTPRRCRPCRTGRSRSAGRRRPARCLRSRRAQVLPWELALPGIGHQPARRGRARPPRRRRRPRAPRAPHTPTRPRSEAPCRPSGVGLGVLVGDLHYGMRVTAVGRRCPVPRAASSGAGHVRPPVAEVAQVDRTVPSAGTRARRARAAPDRRPG